jgi:hypothetical protein
MMLAADYHDLAGVAGIQQDLSCGIAPAGSNQTMIWQLAA